MTRTTSIDADLVSRIVMLAFGKMNHGGPYWCYVAVRPSRFEEFKEKMASKQYNMQSFVADGFGEVVVSGEGSTPPKDVTAKVAEMFEIPIKQLFADTNPMATVLSKVHALTENFQ